MNYILILHNALKYLDHIYLVHKFSNEHILGDNVVQDTIMYGKFSISLVGATVYNYIHFYKKLTVSKKYPAFV